MTPATFVTRHANMRSAERLLSEASRQNPAFRIALPVVSVGFVPQYLLRRAVNRTCALPYRRLIARAIRPIPPLLVLCATQAAARAFR